MNASERIILNIRKYQNRKYLTLGIAGLLNFIIYMMIIWLSTFTADSIFYFQSEVRWFALILNGSLTFFLLYKAMIFPIISYISAIRHKDLTESTREIGGFYPTIQDKLTNIYQLITNRSSRSPDAIREFAINKYEKFFSNKDFVEKIKVQNYLIPLRFSLPIILGSLFLVFMLNDRLLLSMYRIADPAGDYTIIPDHEFIISPGNLEIISGDPVLITAQFLGPEIDKCLLRYQYSGEANKQIILMDQEDDRYTHRLERVSKPLTYSIQAVPAFPADWQNKLISQTFSIHPFIAPVITKLQVKIRPPIYTKLETKLLDPNVGDITGYRGSKVTISGESNKEISLAQLVFADSTNKQCFVRGKRFNIELKIDEDTYYSFHLKDANGIANQNPITYTITSLEDQYPAIQITDPGEDVEIPTDATIPLIFEGRDDFGFSKLTLHYQITRKIREITDSTWNKMPISLQESSGKYFQEVYKWDFSMMPVSFEDQVKYYVSLSDNDVVSGPKTTTSKVYYIYFPSVEQLFEEFDQIQEKQIAVTDDLNEKSKKIKEDLEKISRELKREELDWERKRALRDILERQQDIQKKLEKMDRELEESIEKLEQNKLLSNDIIEKYQRLQSLFREIASSELLEAMKKLQDALNNVNQKQIQKSVEQMKINQEKFRENLERTLALFEKVKLEQELNRLIRMSERLDSQQQEISKKLKQPDLLDQNELDELKNQSDRQVEQLSQLTRSISDLLKNLRISEYRKSDQALQEALKSAGNSERKIDQLTAHLAEDIFDRALEDSEFLEQELKRIYQNLSQAQQNMQAQDKKLILSKMKKITNNLLRLSEKEEKLMQKTAKLSKFSDQYPQIARSQQQLIDNMQTTVRDIVELSHETFLLNQGISRSLGSAYENMQKSITELENRHQRSAKNFQLQSMAGLNKAILEMQSSMSDAQNAQSASGFEQFLQRMQNLSARQGQLNQQTMNFFKGNEGALSTADQRSLQRMAAEQKAIQQAMDELAEDSDKRSDIPGRLGQMTNEMEEVIKDMKTLKIDRKTINRQEKILSRMLDAQKSVREREYSKKRIAEAGRDYQKISPRQPKDFIDERLEKLNLDLIRALQEGYNPDYEKLIEEYFKTLNQNVRQ